MYLHQYNYIDMNTFDINTKSRCQQLADALHQQILAGECQPGDKLPTVDKLMDRFDASRSIVQMAVAKLRDNGFIRCEGRRGMFVDSHPPHLYRFGVLMPCSQGNVNGSRFNQLLIHEAMRLQNQASGYRFEFYYDLSQKDTAGDTQRLLTDISQQTLAGLMVLPECEHLLEHVEIRNSGLAILHLFGPASSDRLPSISAMPDIELIDHVLPAFKSQGAKRIAVLDLSNHPHPQIVQQIQDCGLKSQPSWIQYVSRDFPQAARQIVWLLFELPASKRPDGLLILDDNLMEQVLLGLADCKVQVGRNVQILAHHNWPSEQLNAWPIRRFGMHIGQMLVAASQTLQHIRDGKDVPNYQCMPCWFDDQVPDSVRMDDAIKPLKTLLPVSC